MKIIDADNLSDLVSKSIIECKKGSINNLILHGDCPYSEVDSDFIKTYNILAEKWQCPIRPTDLVFNHGEFIFKYGDPRKFLIEEISHKPDTNRACISLIDTGIIINSGDNPIPSFLILQVGYPSRQNKVLYVATYFRALEVSRFLPINLAEICMYIRLFKENFPSIEKFNLTLHAFRAHLMESFNCFQKSELDIAKKTDIVVAVEHKDLEKLRKWLDSKISISETLVFTEGIELMIESFERFKNKYNNIIIDNLKVALYDMYKLKKLRRSSSHSQEITNLNKSIKKRFEKVRDELQ